MRTPARILALVALTAASAPLASAQDKAPPFASMTASRLLFLPAQEVTGAPEARVWLARFDSLVTAHLEDGGIGAGWAYPRDAVRYSRANPTYTSDPHLMGAQPLKNPKIVKDFSLPEPFASRLRALLAIGNARVAVVPVVAHVDSTKTPRTADVLVMFVDGTLSRVVWRGTISARYDGPPAAAADSLAAGVSRLFVHY